MVVPEKLEACVGCGKPVAAAGGRRAAMHPECRRRVARAALKLFQRAATQLVKERNLWP